MSVDLRTRTDADRTPVDAQAFFSVTLPEALVATRELTEPGLGTLRLRPLTIETEHAAWTLVAENGAVAVRESSDGQARLRLDPEQLADLVHDQATPMTFFAGGTLDMPSGRLADFLDWWLVLRGALDRRPLHVPGAVTFVERDGSPLDLHRSFEPDAPLEEMSHFLHQAGYLHIRGLFGRDEMAAVSADMDRAARSYSEGDGRSWWATTADGTRRLVRMQAFDEHSTVLRELLVEPRFLRIGSITGDGHVHTGLEENRIEALVKPLSVVEGISDLPWHKDCSLGRHSYECCHMNVGISVTGADATSGQLRMVAGSHRALIWPALYQPGRPGTSDLKEVELPTETGDVTVHLSCTLHMSQPPEERERRVMYTSFRFPEVLAATAAGARARLRAVREAAHTTVSQPPAARSTPSESS